MKKESFKASPVMDKPMLVVCYQRIFWVQVGLTLSLFLMSQLGLSEPGKTVLNWIFLVIVSLGPSLQMTMLLIHRLGKNTGGLNVPVLSATALIVLVAALLLWKILTFN